MKKSLLLAAAVCAAVSAQAAVIDLDLSKAKSYSTVGSSTLQYSEEDGVLTVNWTVSTGWVIILAVLVGQMIHGNGTVWPMVFVWMLRGRWKERNMP